MSRQSIRELLSLLVFLFVPLLIFSQPDSILKARNEALQIYDTAKVAMVDTNIFELTRINNAAGNLIQLDNLIINFHLARTNQLNDSLVRQTHLLETLKHNLESQFDASKNRNLTISIAGIICFVIATSITLFYISRRRQFHKAILQHSNQQIIITEYRQKLQELQEELNAARNEAGALMDSLSRHRIDAIKKPHDEVDPS